MIGELVGARYKVINVLGSGGFGHTYIAEDTQRPGNPRCVLKHLTFNSQDLQVLQQVRRLFQAEAETLERLGMHDQIPRLLAYFEEHKQFYLVQEFIEGRPLNNELVKGFHMAEDEVIPLLEDMLNVLEYVHAQGVIHRDIKPANLIRRRQDSKLVLIDFGAVKTIANTVAETTGETSISMPVYTSGYAASEQCLGRPRINSDIYSLGMVGIQALTGLHPSQLPHDYNSSEVIWRDQATVSDELAAVLDKMTRYHFGDRYQSASEALQAIRRVVATAPTLVTQAATVLTPANTPTALAETSLVHPTTPPTTRLPSPGKRSLTRIGLAIAGTLAIAVLVRSLSESPSLLPWQAPATLNSASSEVGDIISDGHKLLNKWRTDSKTQEGSDHFASGNYDQAIAAFEAARNQNPGNPESLIYLNNARIANQKNYTIAAVVPLDSSALDSGLEILRGVAQAQDQINRAGGINGVPIKVVIADDQGKPENARKVAESFANDPSILGVVGHGTSDASLAAAPLYQDKGLVMISPVSSAVELSGLGGYIFRTMPSDRETARALKDYMLGTLKKRNVVIFHNSESKYSHSLKEEFKRALEYSGVKDMNVVEEVDLSQPNFDPEDSVNAAIVKKAEVIMLAPDKEVMDKAIRVIESNDRRLPILAGDSMFTPRLPKLAKGKAVGMVLAVPVDLVGSQFQQQAKTVWGEKELMTWRTALAYDATQSLIAALKQDPTRNGMRRVIAEKNFAAKGSTGVVNFKDEGDREQDPTYVTITQLTGNPKRYGFSPLKPQPTKR